MALILNNCVFIHVPKTGGVWISEALTEAGLVKDKTLRNTIQECSTTHGSYYELEPFFAFDKKPSFCFVRNPVTWWQSRWSDPYHRFFYSEGKAPFLRFWCGSIQWLNYESFIESDDQFNDFNVYIESVLDRHPGMFTDYFNFMTANKGIVIGKQENMVNDLVDILLEFKEDFDPHTIVSHQHENESDTDLDRRYTLDNLEEIIKHEQALMEEFGYSTDIEDYRHLIKEG